MPPYIILCLFPVLLLPVGELLWTHVWWGPGGPGGGPGGPGGGPGGPPRF
ncbi:hypothetical protein Pyn_34606 [Prunus yedoensis var. nudiflora]|uniref:Uncharacterized protein n=1 Tax=Prunus yedoensis var. nudiflora TaxID=2094558 RepID=A0A314YSG5_PRUYE|nr:hypothetical protein Pyn_34606 [Prunus yedoensis var. nudiflora]